MEDFLKFLEGAPGPLLLSLAIVALLKAAKASPHVQDWTIPYAAYAMGAIGYASLSGWTARNFILGIVIGAGAVGMNQGWRQTKDRIQDGPETEETREFRRRFADILNKPNTNPTRNPNENP